MLFTPQKTKVYSRCLLFIVLGILGADLLLTNKGRYDLHTGWRPKGFPSLVWRCMFYMGTYEPWFYVPYCSQSTWIGGWGCICEGSQYHGIEDGAGIYIQTWGSVLTSNPSLNCCTREISWDQWAIVPESMIVGIYDVCWLKDVCMVNG